MISVAVSDKDPLIKGGQVLSAHPTHPGREIAHDKCGSPPTGGGASGMVVGKGIASALLRCFNISGLCLALLRHRANTRRHGSKVYLRLFSHPYFEHICHTRSNIRRLQLIIARVLKT